MHTLKTPHAIVHHHSDFSVIEITLNNPDEPLDIMDIQEIYAAFFRIYLVDRLERLKPDELIKLGHYIGKEYA